MSRMIFAILLVMPFASNSFAGEFRHCENAAATFLEPEVAGEGYDEGEDAFMGYNCRKSTDQRVVVCDVGVSKGDGAATDTYQVIMNSTCTSMFDFELIGEEYKSWIK